MIGPWMFHPCSNSPFWSSPPRLPFSVSSSVAVALRNQKVTINNGNGQVAMVSSSVSIPALSELTVCFEVERIASKQVFDALNVTVTLWFKVEFIQTWFSGWHEFCWFLLRKSGSSPTTVLETAWSSAWARISRGWRWSWTESRARSAPSSPPLTSPPPWGPCVSPGLPLMASSPFTSTASTGTWTAPPQSAALCRRGESSNWEVPLYWLFFWDF